MDTADLEKTEIEGIRKTFEDVDVSTSPPTVRSAFPVEAMIVRNLSGVTLQAKFLAIVDPTNPARVIGVSNTTGQANVVAIDEFLGSAGCVNGDCCWAVVKGPAVVKTPPGAAFAANIAAGDHLVAATGASGSTAAAATTNDHGRVVAASFGTTNNVNTAQIANRFAKALSARTTGQTNADILVHVRPDW